MVSIFTVVIENIVPVCLFLVSWVNGIRVGKVSPYILDGNGNSANAELSACGTRKQDIIVTVTGGSFTTPISQSMHTFLSKYAIHFHWK